MNTLLDTLIRPNADTVLNPKSCVEWRYQPGKAVSHVAIGVAPNPGGQWADDPVTAGADTGTLSYAEQLSLPGYSYADHLAEEGNADDADFVRPSRSEFANYLRAYPEAVGITDAIYTGLKAGNVYRTLDGFMIGSLGIRCKHLVLASGTFNVNIPPPPLLAPLTTLHSQIKPLLVIGSGFSAADVIVAAPPTQRIIHMFQWDPETRSSPLRGCHHTAYPEYAAVYRQMKLASMSSTKSRAVKSPSARRKSNPFFEKRDWALYEGLPNAEVVNVSSSLENGTAAITIRLSSGEMVTRHVGGLAYVVGRRGTLDFLSPDLRSEVLSETDQEDTALETSTLVSGRTLRAKAEISLEVTKNVFITGSLAGDSLIRHAIGGCVYAAGRILGAIPPTFSPIHTPSQMCYTPRSTSPTSTSTPGLASPRIASMASTPSKSKTGRSTPSELTNGHADLHLNRRDLAKAVEAAYAENKQWVDSGWWAGGFGPRKAA